MTDGHWHVAERVVADLKIQPPTFGPAAVFCGAYATIRPAKRASRA